MPVQLTVHPAHCASGNSSALSDARLVSAVATLRDALAPDVALNLPAVLDRTALLAYLSALIANVSCSHPAPAPDALVSVKPPRLNFAGCCIFCTAYGCQSAKCIQNWSDSRWDICTRCAGAGVDDSDEVCGCCHGVVEASRATTEWVALVPVTTPASKPAAVFVNGPEWPKW